MFVPVSCKAGNDVYVCVKDELPRCPAIIHSDIDTLRSCGRFDVRGKELRDTHHTQEERGWRREDVLVMRLGNDQCVPEVHGVNVEKRKYRIILKNFF